jgi:hypothetical protein
MSFLFGLVLDIAAEVFTGSLPPVSPRAGAILLGVVGLLLSATVGTIVWLWPNPGDQPSWSIGLFVCSLLYGAVAASATGVSLVRDPMERGVKIFALTGCLAAIVLPLLPVAR